MYGSLLAPGVASLTNVVGTDAVTATTLVNTTGNTSTSGNLKAGSHTGIEYISALGGADAANYSYGSVVGDYAVSQLALTGASISASGSIYASALNPGVVSFGNIAAGDIVVSTAGVNTGAVSSSGNFVAGSYTQTAGVIAGADAGNYSFAGVTSGANYTIGKLALTGSGITAKDKIYDGTAMATVSTDAAIYTGLVAGDLVSVTATGLFDSKEVGQGKLVTLASSYTGVDIDNYTIISQASTTADITPPVPDGAANISGSLTSVQAGVNGTSQEEAGTSLALGPGAGWGTLAGFADSRLITDNFQSGEAATLSSGGTIIQMGLAADADGAMRMTAGAGFSEESTILVEGLPLYLQADASAPVWQSNHTLKEGGALIPATGSPGGSPSTADMGRSVPFALTFADGAEFHFSVAVTADGFLVITSPPEASGLDLNQVMQSGMVIARDQLRTDLKSLKGVLIRTGQSSFTNL